LKFRQFKAKVENQNFEIEEFLEALNFFKNLLKFRQFKAKFKIDKFENEVIFFGAIFWGFLNCMNLS